MAGLARPASAADFPMEIDCPAWSPESAAQIEARVRANLLAEGLQTQLVQVGCVGADVNVTVQSAAGLLRRPVQPTSSGLEDDVVAAVEAALRDLASPASGAAPAAAVPAASAADQLAPPLVESRQLPPPPPPTASTSAPLVEISLTPEVHRFGARTAAGAAVGLDLGRERFRYGVTLGWRSVLALPSAFSAGEGHAAARVALRLHEAAGLNLGFGVGASLLVASPSPNVETRTSTTLSSPFVDFELSRPFTVGRFGFAPLVGLRWFSGRRNVRVDQKEQLVLPAFAPRAGLCVSYRLH